MNEDRDIIIIGIGVGILGTLINNTGIMIIGILTITSGAFLSIKKEGEETKWHQKKQYTTTTNQ